MALTPDEVRRLAVLARLALSDAEAEALAAQLTDVLEHVDRLEAPAGDELPAADRDVTNRAVGPAPLRADVPGADTLDRPPAEFAPDWRDGFFAVPRLPSHDTLAGEGS